MLYIGVGDVRLKCICSTVESHSMKLSTLHYWTNLKTSRSLDIYNYREDTVKKAGYICTQWASASDDPTLRFYVVYHFVANLMFYSNYFKLLSLTVDIRLFSCKEISWLDLFGYATTMLHWL